MSICEKCKQEIDIRRCKDGKVIVLNTNEVAFRESPYGSETGMVDGELVNGYSISENDEQGYRYIRKLHRYDCVGEIK